MHVPPGTSLGELFIRNDLVEKFLARQPLFVDVGPALPMPRTALIGTPDALLQIAVHVSKLCSEPRLAGDRQMSHKYVCGDFHRKGPPARRHHGMLTSNPAACGIGAEYHTRSIGGETPAAPGSRRNNSSETSGPPIATSKSRSPRTPISFAFRAVSFINGTFKRLTTRISAPWWAI